VLPSDRELAVISGPPSAFTEDVLFGSPPVHVGERTYGRRGRRARRARDNAVAADDGSDGSDGSEVSSSASDRDASPAHAEVLEMEQTPRRSARVSTLPVQVPQAQVVISIQTQMRRLFNLNTAKTHPYVQLLSRLTHV
jgi:hypothetical protein